MSHPLPFTPADSDLRDFAFMPLHVAKLRDSDLAATADPEACWYAVLLWCSAWHQLPAGSLPDDDKVLCRLIGLGRDLGTWNRHKAEAMRGWTKCSDGRLYHKTVADAVASSWLGKLKKRHASYCASIRNHNAKNPKDQAFAMPFEDWAECGRPISLRDETPPKKQPDLFGSGDDSANHDDDSANLGKDSAKTPSKGDSSKGRGRLKGDSIDSTADAVVRARARKTPCPEDFSPDPSPGTKTAQRMDEWSPAQLAVQVERFIAHHQKKDDRFVSWQQAWTTWVLSDFNERNRRNGHDSRDGFERAIDRSLGLD